MAGDQSVQSWSRPAVAGGQGHGQQAMWGSASPGSSRFGSGLVSTANNTPIRPASQQQHIRLDTANLGKRPVSSPSRPADTGAQMGGVGLVFFRDPGSPYLLVKDVVPDGPAFKSSLIYPGDKLCCINDFDLSWSGSTPRSQQPQLPGQHGTAVTLTFDRSVDSSYPERFTITLIRNMAYYPDRLSSSPYKPVVESDGNDSSSSARGASNARVPQTSTLQSASPPPQKINSITSRPQTAQISPVPRVQTTTTFSSLSNAARQELLPAQPSSLPQNPPIAPNVNAKEPSAPQSRAWNAQPAYSGWEKNNAPQRAPSGDMRETDANSLMSNDDLDDLIQEIARKDRVLDLQSKLSAGEMEHEKKIKEFQKNQAALEQLVTTLRAEVHAERNRANELELQLRKKSEDSFKGSEQEQQLQEIKVQATKERAMWQAKENQLTTERDTAVSKVQMLEEGVRKQLRELESELDRERSMRQKLEQSQAKHPMDVTLLRQVQTEKELLEAQNEDLRRELMEMKIHFSRSGDTRAALLPDPPRHEAPKAYINDSPDSAEPAKDMSNQYMVPSIPGLQANAATHPSEDVQSPEPVTAPGKDVELHQSPGSARVARERTASAERTSERSNKEPTVLQPFPARSIPNRVGHLNEEQINHHVSNQATSINSSPASSVRDAPAAKTLQSTPAASLDIQNKAAGISTQSNPGSYTKGPEEAQEQISPLTSVESRTRSNSNLSPATSIRAGVGMSFHADPSTRRYIITDVHPHGPAGKAVVQGKMMIGDALLAVNGGTTQGRTIPSIVNDILGEEGTPVHLSIARTQQGEVAGHHTVVTLIRSRPQTSSEPSSGGTTGGQEPMKEAPNGMPSPDNGTESSKLNLGATTSTVPGSQDKIVLPPGWVVEVDPTSGRTYYVNHTLKTFSWARPGQTVVPSR